MESENPAAPALAPTGSEADAARADFGCFLARGFGEGACEVDELSVEDVVRFLDRERADTLSGDTGAWDAALRTEGKVTDGDG